MHRRQAVMAAFGCMAIAGATINTAEGEEAIAKAAESGNGVGPKGPLSSHPTDQMLELALKSPQALQFCEELTTKLDSKADLVVTSSRDAQGRQSYVYVRTGTMRVFRADAVQDDFTKQGGWHWRCGDIKGKSQFKSPMGESIIPPPEGAGPLVMVIRQLDGTAHWYSLTADFRC